MIRGDSATGKYGTLRQSYHEFYRIYGTDALKREIRPDGILTEDSSSGYQFFDHVCKKYHLKCDTANGKSNTFHFLNTHPYEKVLVIADGAAFGPEIDRVMRLLEGREHAALYLPESFEWLILSSGILKDNEIRYMLEDPSAYIDSREYISWERYFTALLVKKTEGTHLAYSK